MTKLFDRTKFGVRIRAIRDASGLSQQKFSNKCGIGQSTLANVELGNNTPGVDFLLQVWSANPNVDLEWLLTGEGEMTSGAGPAVPSKPSPPVVEDELVRELQELRLIAKRGSQAGAWKVLVALREAMQPLTRSELATAIKSSDAELAADLALLRRAKLVTETADGLLAPEPNLMSASSADVAQHALEAIQLLLRHMVPAAERADGSGEILVIEAGGTEGSGRELMAAVRELVRARLESDFDGPERIRIVIAIQTEGVS